MQFTRENGFDKVFIEICWDKRSHELPPNLTGDEPNRYLKPSFNPNTNPNPNGTFQEMIELATPTISAVTEARHTISIFSNNYSIFRHNFRCDRGTPTKPNTQS